MRADKLRVPAGTLGWLLATVLVATLASSPGEQAGRVLLRPALGLRELIANLLLFAPAAALLAASAPGEPLRRAVLRIAGLVAAASLTIEIIQYARPGRYTEPFDIVTNTIGAALVAAVIRMRPTSSSRALSIERWVGAATLLLVAAALGASTALALRLSRIEFWDPAYEILVGDESTGGREFRGMVGDARICAGGREGEVCAGPGADLLLRAAVADSAWQTQKLTAFARVLSATDEQSGPARILTFSRDAEARNLTLGASGRTLELRLRTPLAGSNGLRAAYRLPDALHPGVWTTVRVRATRGRVELRADSDAATATAVYPIGLLTGWHFVTAGEIHPWPLGAAAAGAAVALFLPFGLIAGRVRGSAGRALLAAALAAAVVQLTVHAVLQAPVHTPHLLLAIGMALCGVPIGRFDRSRTSLPGPDRPGAHDSLDTRRQP